MTFCAMCGGSDSTPNYAKLVDPPISPYGSILGDSCQQPCRPSVTQQAAIPVQLCLPQVTQMGGGMGGLGQGCVGMGNGMVVQVPRDPPRPCPQIICEPCPPPPPTKVWLIKSSPMPPKSFAIAQPPPCNPCSKPIIVPCRPYC